MSLFVVFLFIHFSLSILYSTWVKSYSSFSFPSSLFHLAEYSQDLSKLLQMGIFHLFNGWVVFCCIYVPHLPYPIIHWKRLFPCPSFCEWCCNEHRGTHSFIFMKSVFKLFRCITRKGIAGSYSSSILNFWGNIYTVSIVTVPYYSPISSEGFLFSTFSPTFVISCLIETTILTSVRWISLWFQFAFSPYN